MRAVVLDGCAADVLVRSRADCRQIVGAGLARDVVRAREAALEPAPADVALIEQIADVLAARCPYQAAV